MTEVASARVGDGVGYQPAVADARDYFALMKPRVMSLVVFTAFVGLLTHCNVEMRFGPPNYLFNTPALHRWHHSMDLREGNKNYGENLMIFDLLFGTWVDAPRRPPAVIGVREPIPKDFIGQVLAPFRAAPWRSVEEQGATNALATNDR